MRIDSISIQGSNEWNEDALIINDELKIYGVADGATSLVPYRSEKGETGGRLASQLVKSYFEDVDSSKSRSLEEHLIEINHALGHKMESEGINTSLKDNLWTTGAAIVRINENNVEYVQTGDCMIVALYQGGSHRVITRDHIARFDEKTRVKWSQAIDEGYCTQREIRARVVPIIKENKAKINTLQGYSVIDGSKEASLFFESGKINRIFLTGLIICTDGLFMHDDKDSKVRLNPIDELVKQTSIVGIEGYINYLNALENMDPECQRFLRFKKSDDKTAIFIDLNY